MYINLMTEKCSKTICRFEFGFWWPNLRETDYDHIGKQFIREGLKTPPSICGHV